MSWRWQSLPQKSIFRIEAFGRPIRGTFWFLLIEQLSSVRKVCLLCESFANYESSNWIVIRPVIFGHSLAEKEKR